jgi:hypothetical protein
MKADYDKWVDSKKDLSYSDWMANESKYINQFAEDYAKDEDNVEAIIIDFTNWLNKDLDIPIVLSSEITGYLNQKFNEDADV